MFWLPRERFLSVAITIKSLLRSVHGKDYRKSKKYLWPILKGFVLFKNVWRQSSGTKCTQTLTLTYCNLHFSSLLTIKIAPISFPGFIRFWYDPVSIYLFKVSTRNFIKKVAQRSPQVASKIQSNPVPRSISICLGRQTRFAKTAIRFNTAYSNKVYSIWRTMKF